MKRTRGFLLLVTLFSFTYTYAIINPTFQPADMAEDSAVILVGKITLYDKTNGLKLTFDHVIKGEVKAPVSVEVRVGEEDREVFATLEKDFRPGSLAVLLVQKMEGGEGTAGAFLHTNGCWFDIRGPANFTAQWKAVFIGPNRINDGCFEGATRRLAELMADVVLERAHFPVEAGFSDGQEILVGSVGEGAGLAVADFDNDGRLDVFAASPKGCRMFHNEGGFKFKPVAGPWEKLNSRSAGVAAVNDDGRGDLLLDGPNVLLNLEAGWKLFSPGPATGMTGAFLDADGDGKADLVGVDSDGRLELWTGDGKGGFEPSASATGLRAPGPGLIAAGDVNGDGRMDFFVAAGAGLLAVSGKDGEYQRCQIKGQEWQLQHPFEGSALFLDHDLDGDLDLFLMGPPRLNLCENDGHGQFVECIWAAAEIAVLADRSLPVGACAGDPNLDGRPDLYVSTQPNQTEDDARENDIFINRGYGVYLSMHRNFQLFEKAPGFKEGARGCAWADLDNDGAPELLTVTPAGKIYAFENLARRGREKSENGAVRLRTHVPGAVLELWQNKRRLGRVAIGLPGGYGSQCVEGVIGRLEGAECEAVLSLPGGKSFKLQLEEDSSPISLTFDGAKLSAKTTKP